jgi:hypothetical protein
MLQVIRGVVSDDVDNRAISPPRVVKVRKSIRKAWAGMQQGCGRPPRHSRVAVGGAGDHALEQTEHATHCRLSIQGGDKMHLGRAGVGEANINSVNEKDVAEEISPVHTLPQVSVEFASRVARAQLAKLKPPIGRRNPRLQSKVRFLVLLARS